MIVYLLFFLMRFWKKKKKWWELCCSLMWCLWYRPVMRGSPGWCSFTEGSKQDRMWFLEVTPLFPFSGEVRLQKHNPGRYSLPFTSVYNKEKTGSTPSLNIQMCGFMIMWRNKDENHPHSQMEKKKMFECNVQCRHSSAWAFVSF